jgi:hypothetical protein
MEDFNTVGFGGIRRKIRYLGPRVHGFQAVNGDSLERIGD